MSAVGEQISAKLEELGPSVAVAFEFSIQNYFDVLRGLVDEFATPREVKCIYITSSVPSSTITSTFQALEVNTSNLYFVDCISQMISGVVQQKDRTIYVESPTVLENIVLKVEYFLRKLGSGPKLVVIDSINSLSIHNDPKMLSEFLHILISNLSTREVYPVILSIGEQTKADIREMLNLVCDQVVTLQNGQQK
jgi:KaiC/GvpD/RAD55 family RecA-like ATPase